MKVKISTDQYQSYKDYISKKTNIIELHKVMQQKFENKWNISFYKEIGDKFKDLFNLGFMGDKNTKFTPYQKDLENMEILIPFAASKDRAWEAVGVDEFLLITFSGNTFFFLADFTTIVEEPDYEHMSIADMKRELLKGDEEPLSFLPETMGTLTIADAKENISDIEKKETGT